MRLSELSELSGVSPVTSRRRRLTNILISAAVHGRTYMSDFLRFTRHLQVGGAIRHRASIRVPLANSA